jgi:hypothetical protein
MNLLSKLFGAAKSSLSGRIAARFKALDECQRGLSREIVDYILSDAGSGVLSTLSTARVRNHWSSGGHVYLTSEPHRQLFAEGVRWDLMQMARLGDVEAALRPLSGGVVWGFMGTSHSPDWLRHMLSALASKGGKIFSLETLSELVTARGLGTDVVIDIVFSRDPQSYRFDHSINHFDGVETWLAAHASEIVAVAHKLAAPARSQLIAAIGRFAQTAVFLDFLVESGMASSKQVREAAQKTLTGADLQQLQARLHDVFPSRSPVARAELVTLAAHGLGAKATQLLQQWRTDEQSAKVLAAIDQTLAHAALSAGDAATDQADGHAYLALDGSLVAIPPMPPLPAPSAIPDQTMQLLLPAIRSHNHVVEAGLREAAASKEHWHWTNYSKPIEERKLARMKEVAETVGSRDRQRDLFQWMLLRQKNDRSGIDAFFASPSLSLRHLVKIAISNWGTGLLGLLANEDVPVAAALRRRLAQGADLRNIQALWIEGGGEDAIIDYLERDWGRALDTIDPDKLWPLIVDRLDYVDEALGFRPQSGKVPLKLDAALELLAVLPAVPQRFLLPLMTIATGTRKGPRGEARKLLAGAPHIESSIAGLMADGKQEVRAGAAEWLAQRSAKASIAAIRAALKSEKSDVCRAAMISALERLGEDVSDFFDPVRMKQEAERGLAKTQSKGLDWFPMDALPALIWRDGTSVDKVLVQWWVVLANKLKQPGGNAMMDLCLDRLAPRDAHRLGQSVFAAWIAEDTRTTSLEDANAQAQAEVDGRLRTHLQWAKQHPESASAWITDRGLLFAQIRNEKLGTYLGSAVDNKGLLALTTRIDGIDMAKMARGYLKNHGSRVSQSKAVLEALAANPSGAAIQIVLATANRFKARTVQAHAGALIEDIASRRGWTTEELADRTIPTAGLDETGTAELNCGQGRTYRLLLDATDTLVLLNAAGDPVKDLPKPRTEEEKSLLDEAKKLLATARKEIKQIMPDQTSRLREAMCLERTWSVEDWNLYVLGHPLIARLARRLVWIGLDESGAVMESFRPLDDNTLTDTDDRPINLAEFSRIQLAHSRLLPDDIVQVWKAHLADYEVAPPFDQFGRVLPSLAPTDKDKKAIGDRNGWMIETFKLRGAATKLGYVRGAAEDGGWFITYERRYQTAGLVALINFSGSPLPEENRVTALLELTFAKLRRNSNAYGNPVTLGEVPPVLLAETWQDLYEIAAKGTGFDPQWEKSLQW